MSHTKLERFMEFLDKIRGNEKEEKKLIFSLYPELLDVVGALRVLEWGARPCGILSTKRCPCCGRKAEKGHEEDCLMKKAIAALTTYDEIPAKAETPERYVRTDNAHWNRIVGKTLVEVEERTRSESGSGAPEVAFTFSDSSGDHGETELTVFVHDDGALVLETD